MIPEWKQDLIQPIKRAVYSAAVGVSDAEILRIVKDTLRRARRDLSS